MAGQCAGVCSFESTIQTFGSKRTCLGATPEGYGYDLMKVVAFLL